MARFSFSLDSFDISETRSRHEDTDFVTLSLTVNTTGILSQTRRMGNVNNGHFLIEMMAGNFVMNEGDVLYMSYLIVNAGHSPPGQIETLIESTGVKLATAGGTAVAGAIIGSGVPIVGTVLGAIAGYLAGQFETVLTANCDGPVAAEMETFTYDQMVQWTAGGPMKITTKHPGVDSAHGCGQNSQYLVSWHIDAGEPTNWDGRGEPFLGEGGGTPVVGPGGLYHMN